ncbi:hypothetical protein MRX96_003435 [Rhipicephalus microplus]
MKSVKKKLREMLNPNLLDIRECNLHKVHNAFGTGLNSFGYDVELLVMDIYYFFKQAIHSSQLSEKQKDLGIPEHVFLRHVSSRWLTFQSSLERVLQQFEVLKAFFQTEAGATPTSAVLQKRLASALSDKTILAKMLFLRNTAELLSEFQTVFQKEEPLVHIVHSKCIGLVRKLLSRFMKHEAYCNLFGNELKQLDVGSPEWLKQVLEIGSDTEKEMRNWDPQEKKSFRTSAQAFYISTARHLIKRLPLDNKLLYHLRFLDPICSLPVEETVQSIKYVAAGVPHMIKGEQVTSLVDQWHCLHSQPISAAAHLPAPQHRWLLGFSVSFRKVSSRVSVCTSHVVPSTWKRRLRTWV